LAKKPGKTKKKFKRGRFWLKFILIIGLLSATLFLLAISPLFNIDGIEVKGNNHYSSAAIVEIADISTGSNGFKVIGKDLKSILSLRYGTAEKRILSSCPYIKDAEVRYAIPRKVYINIVERNPIGVIPYLGTSLLIDEEGYVLDTVKEPGKDKLITIKGFEFENYELGKKLVLENEYSLENAVDVMKAMEDSDKNDRFKILGLVEGVDVSDGENIRLFVDSRLVVNLGDLQDISYRIGVVKEILQKNLKKKERGLLDFTTGENPIFTPEK